MLSVQMLDTIHLLPETKIFFFSTFTPSLKKVDSLAHTSSIYLPLHFVSLSSSSTSSLTFLSVLLLFNSFLAAVAASDRKARRLYYADVRERVLRSECRQQEALYFQLAGYALQADLADCPQPGQADGEVQYFQPKDYFPPWVSVCVSVPVG